MIFVTPCFMAILWGLQKTTLKNLKTLSISFRLSLNDTSLFHLKRLTKLELRYGGGENVKVLKTDGFKLKTLLFRQCRFNNPYKLNNLLEYQPQLKSLTLLSCHLNGVGLDVMSNIPVLYDSKNKKVTKTLQLQKLRIRYCGINYIRNLNIFPFLQSLDLSSNNIHKIENLNNVPNLLSLNLSHNRIKKIENLDKVPNLLYLTLSFNELITIEGLNNVPNLRSLDLCNNQITKIQNLNNVKNLYTLRLAHTHLETVENLNKLPNLHVLDLHQTSIED